MLDNCEHLLDAVGALVHGVVLGASNVKVLATSQEPLRLADEQQFRVMPLAIPSSAAIAGVREFGSMALFGARARAVDPHFRLDDEGMALVIDICSRLDGLPLAIELAEVRAPKLGLHAVRDKLDERFRLLTGGSRVALRRHQTLRAALEWSHGLLNAEEQAVFGRLGVFAGGFSMKLAQAVCGDARLDEWAVIDHLSALVDKALVVAEPGEPPRYRLLESARAPMRWSNLRRAARLPRHGDGTHAPFAIFSASSTTPFSMAICAPTSTSRSSRWNWITCARPMLGRAATRATWRWQSCWRCARVRTPTSRSIASTGCSPSKRVWKKASPLRSPRATGWRSPAPGCSIACLARFRPKPRAGPSSCTAPSAKPDASFSVW